MSARVDGSVCVRGTGGQAEDGPPRRPQEETLITQEWKLGTRKCQGKLKRVDMCLCLIEVMSLWQIIVSERTFYGDGHRVQCEYNYN